jgi:hypothetical protein
VKKYEFKRLVGATEKLAFSLMKSIKLHRKSKNEKLLSFSVEYFSNREKRRTYLVSVLVDSNIEFAIF